MVTSMADGVVMYLGYPPAIRHCKLKTFQRHHFEIVSIYFSGFLGPYADADVNGWSGSALCRVRSDELGAVMTILESSGDHWRPTRNAFFDPDGTQCFPMFPDGSQWFPTCSHSFRLKLTQVTNGYQWIHATAQNRFQRHQFLLYSRNFNGLLCPRSRSSRSFQNFPIVRSVAEDVCLGYPPTLHTWFPETSF